MENLTFFLQEILDFVDEQYNAIKRPETVSLSMEHKYIQLTRKMTKAISSSLSFTRDFEAIMQDNSLNFSTNEQVRNTNVHQDKFEMSKQNDLNELRTKSNKNETVKSSVSEIKEEMITDNDWPGNFFEPVVKNSQEISIDKDNIPYIKEENNTTNEINENTEESNLSLKPDPENLLQSNLSKVTLNSKENLAEHSLVHHGTRKPFMCSHCCKTFTLKSNLTKHLPQHFGKQPNQCNVSGNMITKKTDLNSNEALPLIEYNIQCEKSIPNKKEYNNEVDTTNEVDTSIQKVTNSKQENLTVKIRKFSKNENVRNTNVHQDKFEISKQNDLNELRTKSIRNKTVKSSVSEIEKEMITNKEEYNNVIDPTNKVDTSIPKVTDLEQKIPPVEVRVKLFKCKIGNKKFKSRKTLSRHKLTHTDVKQEFILSNQMTTRNKSEKKQFKCNMYEKTFVKGKYFNQHILNHSRLNASLYCLQCNKKFSSKSNLTKHLLLHTGLKPFKCTICGHKFSQKINLTYHMITHTKIKPFACEVCPKRFTRKYGCKIHSKIHFNLPNSDFNVN